MILVSHPTGNAFVRALLDGLDARGHLERFYTTVGFRPDSSGFELLPARWHRELMRRSFDIPRERMRTRPHREAVRLLSTRMGIHRLSRNERGWASIDRVYGDLDAYVARQIRSGSEHPDAVYCYEDGALETFRAAGGRDMLKVYDLPIGYWQAGRRIQAEEADRNPAWAGTMRAMSDSEEKLERKDRELRRADLVVVASSFTRRTLEEAPAFEAPVAVVPYGSPAVSDFDEPPAYRDETPLRVLYVGGLTQRKGLSYFLEALEGFDSHVEVTLIGRRAGPCEPLDRALEAYRWIPTLPHDGVLREMARHDVLVFPSLFEGFGLVILEAMSRGTPVITTDHTAGPDIITDGEDGFIVPVRSSESISEKIDALIRDRALLRAMSRAAHRRAADFQWSGYAREIDRILESSIRSEEEVPVA